MGFKCGIVGLPNVGKSSLFNALTQSAVSAENYPFCTIEPNVGMVSVPDPRLDQIAHLVAPQETIRAAMEFVDIAGLVAGASQGEGLGNKFLAHIRETQAIAHVARCFDDDNVVHVAGRVDPIADIEVVETELALADLETVTNSLARAEKLARIGDKAARERVDALNIINAALDDGVGVHALELDDSQREVVKSLSLLTAKPVLFVANVAEADIAGNAQSQKVKAYADAHNAGCVVISAALEAEIAVLDDADRAEFLADLGLAEAGLDRFIWAGYRLLGLQTYFTAGPKECRAWTIPSDSTAPASAGVIHSDFEKGFIRAEVIAFDDYIEYGGEAGAKEAGRLRLEGKEYIVADGDVMHFRFNV